MNNHQPSAFSGQLTQCLGTVIVLTAIVTAPAVADDAPPPENQCVKCHLEQEEDDPDLAAPPKEWRQSIHHGNGIACNDCHGGNPDAEDQDAAHDDEEAEFIGAPADDDIPRVCGECHIAVHENYIKSKHWLTDKEKRPVCTTCHSAHKIQKATLELINEETCSECHKYERSKRIKVAMGGTEARIVDIETRIQDLKSEGVDVRSLEKAHFAQRNVFHQLSHVLDLDKVIEIAENVSKDTRTLSARVESEESVLSRRKTVGAFVALFLLAGAFIMHRKRKDLDGSDHP